MKYIDPKTSTLELAKSQIENGFIQVLHKK